MSLEVAFETGRLYGPLKQIADSRKDVYSSFLSLPGLRGFWPMSAIDASGNAIDLSGHAQSLTLNGTPTYNGMPSYITLNGSTDYLSHTDNALYDVLGSESYIDPAWQGLTLGGWFYVTGGNGSYRSLITKDGGTSARSYALNITNTEKYTMYAFQSDATYITASDPNNLTYNTWTFVVGRFAPLVCSVIINGLVVNSTTAITALQNTATPLRIGRDGAGKHLPGRASQVFLCAAAVPDATIDNLYQTSRILFGV